ncbi:MAG: hypothetical protein RI973_1101 [Bacteroidota bacterium]|jgi:hypothetical protein
MKNIFLLISRNVISTLLILIVVNFLIVTAWEAKRGIDQFKSRILGIEEKNTDHKAHLPNYKDFPWATTFFNEFRPLAILNYKSYVGWRRPPFKGETINVDEAGMRRTVQHTGVSPDADTIVMLGGSTMWGEGTNDENTIPSLLAARCEGRFKVLNLGEQGYRPFQSFIYLHLQLNEGLKPKWVITYDGVNEALGYYQEVDPISSFAELGIRESLKESRERKDYTRELSYQNFFLSPIEKTVQYFKDKNKKPQLRAMDMSNTRGEAVALSLLDSWLSIYDLAEKNEAGFLAILQPNIGVGHPRKDHIQLSPTEQQLTDAYLDLYPRVRHLLETDSKYKVLRGKVLDYTDAYDGDDFIYIDICHVSPQGNQIIADRIWKDIKRRE